MKLKILYIIILLMPVVANEIILKLTDFEMIELNMMDDLHDDSNEKESKEQIEDESKVEYFLDNLSIEFFKNNKSHLHNTTKTYSIPQPLLEIFSPPPEFI